MLEGPVLPQTPEFYLWPENAQAWSVFMATGPAWRSGASGRDGLDYPSVEIIIRDVCRVRHRDRRQRMREVHLMANAALDEWAQARQRGG